jgi:hypothetical protein
MHIAKEENWMTGMNWDDLRYFLALARQGTVSGAGRVLAVKHTTVARRIAALETRLGSRLFDRSAEGYAMTQVADKFWQVKNQERKNSDLFVSNNRPTPFSERTYPEVTVMLSTDRVPAQIE